MEALLFALIGFALLYPCINYHRTGHSPMLGLLPALVLPVFIVMIPFLPRIYTFLFPLETFPTYHALEVARDFLWTAGGVFFGFYYVFVILQFTYGGAAAKDRWKLLEARVDAAVASDDIDTAVTLYENALRKDPTDFRGHFKYALFLKKHGFVKKCYEQLLLSIEHSDAESRPVLIAEGEKLLGAEKSNEHILEQFRRFCARYR
ncbi:MAG: hypothetical protein Kow00107_10240 [Planctomycetota bacterium]